MRPESPEGFFKVNHKGLGMSLTRLGGTISFKGCHQKFEAIPIFRESYNGFSVNVRFDGVMKHDGRKTISLSGLLCRWV
jgi:hypothetical protein